MFVFELECLGMMLPLMICVHRSLWFMYLQLELELLLDGMALTYWWCLVFWYWWLLLPLLLCLW